MRKVLFSLLLVCPVTLFAANVTIGSSGRVTLELIGSDAAFRNTLSVASPAVAVAITGCKLEPATGLGGVHVLSEKTSQRGCRVDLDSDTGTPGIQGFTAGTVFELRMCAQTDADADCEYVWSSNASSNSDSFDHVQTTAIVPGQAFRLNWEDLPGGGDSDFNDLIAVLRVASDADGDGLWDDWESTGIDTDGNGTIDLDLPALGADPQRKNLFVEIDWMDCAIAGSDCAAGDTHNHRPLNTAVTAVVNAFANATSVTNPDGSTGITLRVDVSNSIPHQNAMNIPGLCFSGGAGIGNFDTIKADPANFGPNNPRRFAYRYGIFSHRQVAGSTVSGCGELPGNDFQVSLGGWNYWCIGGTNNGRRCAVAGDCPGGTCGGDFDGDGNADQDTGTVQQQAGTLMHEFGHNLNLMHGGNDNVNRKPNYLSVMNYAFQMPGIPPTDPDGAGAPLIGRVDFSPVVLPALNETNLGEATGIGDGTDNTFYFCPNQALNAGAGTGAIDWNCDGDLIDTALTADINNDRVCVGSGANGILDTPASIDDVVNGTQIWDGPNRTCDTTRMGDDVQVRAAGNVQTTPLNGFADWANILYEFQSTLAYEDGDHTSVLHVQELDFTEYVETVAPDVSVEMSASPDPVQTGSNVTYTITVRNARPAASGNVVVADVLPEELTYVSCSSTGGGLCAGSGNNRSVTFASIPGGEAATITLVGAANCSLPDGAAIHNSASAETTPDADLSNNSASVSVNASNPAPVISDVSVDKPQLWPVSHKMIDVVVSYNVTDNCPGVSTTLSVSSNEATDGNGDGDTTPDWEVVDANRVRVRAERSGTGSGRTYTITITATDGGNATSTATTSVIVPKHR